MPSETVIRLDGVSVRYRIPLGEAVTLKEAIVRGHWRRWMEHEALSGVDLSVCRGESVGILGPNGAGKTTLLKVLARVLHPTEGRTRIRGRVSAILDLMGAFDPELTGRENVVLNAAVFGMSHREIRERMDEIEAFADIGRFIDAPLRTYSSGMIVRLAFAVASNVDGDIIAIDEALGVGDAEFQKKCAARLQEIRSRGATFVIVSHDVGRLMEWCDRVVWLDRGRVRAIGAPREIVAEYLGGGSA